MLRFSLPLFAALLPAAVLAQDADHDGAPDYADAFPCDASAAAVSYAPAEGVHGTFVAEDQWPSQGDLDFNDVVLSYHLEHRLDAVGRVTSIRVSITPLALGGRQDNGLGLHLPLPASAVARVTRTLEGGAPTPLALAADAQATFTILPDLRALFGDTAGQINSVGDTTVEGQALEILIELSTPTALTLSQAPYDLYVFRSDDPGHEIHRPAYAGTAAMRTALFGTADDGSTSARRFVDTDGLPFVLLLPERAAYPAEAVEIAALFPRITTFASSGGTAAQDFYLQPQLAAAFPGTAITPRLITPVTAADQSCLPTIVTNGLSMWLRADDLAAAATGTPVSTWTDASSGVSATQGAEGSRPTLQRNSLRGHAVVRFDGVDDRLDLSTHLFERGNHPLAVFVVLRTTDTSAHVVGTGSSDLGFVTTYGQGLSIDGGRPLLKSNWNSSGTRAHSAAAVSDGQPRVLSAIIDSRRSVLRVDGLRVAETTVVPNAYTYVRSTLGASDGMAQGNARDPLAGDIAEIVVFRRTLSGTERQDVEAYLGNKYGIAIAQEAGCDGVVGSGAEIDACGICGHANGASCAAVPRTGLAVWLRAHDAAGSGEGGSVTEWSGTVDGSITAVTQGTSTRAPRYRANAVNGFGALEFDGVDDRLDFPTNLFSTWPRTVFVVLATSQANAHVIGHGSSSAGFLTTYGNALTVTSGRPTLKGNSNGSGLHLPSTTVINDGRFRTIAAIGQAGGSSIFVGSGAATTSATSPVTYAPYSRSSIGASDGAASNAARDPFAGRIAEILVYERALDATERAAVQTYLAAKYGTY